MTLDSFAHVVSAWLPPHRQRGVVVVLARQRIPRSAEGIIRPAANACSRVVNHRQQGTALCAIKDEEEEEPRITKKPSKQQRSSKQPKTKDEAKIKQDLVQAIGKQMKKRKAQQQQQQQQSIVSNNNNVMEDESTAAENILDRINPFKAGQNLRKTIDSALTSIQIPTSNSDAFKSIYYLDDRFMESSSSSSSSSSSNARTSDPRKLLEQEAYVPEVLVVGATGAVGRLVVRQLQLSGRFRVRVLVRDLYTHTLNLLGTGVTYCQGDLTNVEQLEYALTDVDKLVFCAAAPRPDEDQFQTKFRDFLMENTQTQQQQSASSVTMSPTAPKGAPKTTIATTPMTTAINAAAAAGGGSDSHEWERHESVRAVRAALAEQVDVIGMQNLVRAYQHVRHADYGTSQAAKRSLFKFQDRPEDFNLFDIDEDDNADYENSNSSTTTSAIAPLTDSPSRTVTDKASKKVTTDSYYDEEGEDDYSVQDTTYDYDNDNDDYEDIYADDYEDDDYMTSTTDIEKRSDSLSVKTQSRWMRNQFKHSVFVGRIPQTQSVTSRGGGEAAIVSSRLRSRDDPENGIELGPGFVGFICRVCSDGGTYEAFVRTGAYYSGGIEYVCEFSTGSKSTGTSKSRNKFTTVRLPFANFTPVQRKSSSTNDSSSSSNDDEDSATSYPPFRGRDVRNIGFRFQSSRNVMKAKTYDKKGNEWNCFYLALSYIKLYRSQPEPEFVYLSDARIPPVVRDNMVRHDVKQLVTTTSPFTTTSAGSGGLLAEGGSQEIRWLDESASFSSTDQTGRSPEETYCKFRGEEILKNSGLSYAIVRVYGFNESPSGDSSTIALTHDYNINHNNNNNEVESSGGVIESVSRADVAKICVSALLEPHALNKSFYVGKKKRGSQDDEDMSAKFSALPMDQIA